MGEELGLAGTNGIPARTRRRGGANTRPCRGLTFVALPGGRRNPDEFGDLFARQRRLHELEIIASRIVALMPRMRSGDSAALGRNSSRMRTASRSEIFP